MFTKIPRGALFFFFLLLNFWFSLPPYKIAKYSSHECKPWFFYNQKTPHKQFFWQSPFFWKRKKTIAQICAILTTTKKIVVVSTKQQSCLLQKNFIMMYKKTSTRFLCLSYNLAFAQHNQKRKKCVKTFVLWVLLLIEQCQRIEIIQLHLVSDKERTPSQITKNIYSQDFLQTTKKSGGLSSV